MLRNIFNTEEKQKYTNGLQLIGNCTQWNYQAVHWHNCYPVKRVIKGDNFCLTRETSFLTVYYLHREYIVDGNSC